MRDKYTYMEVGSHLVVAQPVLALDVVEQRAVGHCAGETRRMQEFVVAGQGTDAMCRMDTGR